VGGGHVKPWHGGGGGEEMIGLPTGEQKNEDHQVTKLCKGKRSNEKKGWGRKKGGGGKGTERGKKKTSKERKKKRG